MKAIQIDQFGRPADVLQLVEIPDVGAPAAGEVIIAVEASPINQYDLLMIAGGYTAIGPAYPPSWVPKELATWSRWALVSNIWEGDRALVPFLHPAWAERIKTDASWLRPLPPGDLNQFAM